MNKSISFPIVFFLYFITNLPLLCVAQESILSTFSNLYLNKLIAAARENYPRVKIYQHQIASANTNLSEAKVSWLEPFSFQYVTRSNRAGSNLIDITTADVLNGYQFGVSISPGSLLAKPSQIRRAKEQLNVVKQEREEYFLNLESEVKSRYFRYLMTEKTISHLNRQLIDAESTLNSLKVAYEKAQTTLQSVNDASTAVNQAYISKLEAEANYLIAKAALEELTVKKLEQIK